MNISWSRRILEILHGQGVRDIVYCPGARNSPLVSTLAYTHAFELHSFPEERSAAFYTLGIARRSGQPAAIITTSGTAAAECLPAVIEAFHTGVPLVVITADRPRRLRGSGAPQAIDQTGLFAKFVQMEFDLENAEEFALEAWNRRSPVHVNVCFDEPLLDEPQEDFEFPLAEVWSSYTGHSRFAVSAGPEWAVLRLTKFLRLDGPLVVVVGTLETSEERAAATAFLAELGAPVYLEANSGLREEPRLAALALRSGDKVLAWALRRGMIARVLRIGGVPTVRIWRDLEEPTSQVEVLSLSPLPFAGLSRGEIVCAEVAAVLNSVHLYSVFRNTLALSHEALLEKDRQAKAALEEIFLTEPLAEPSLVRALSLLIPESALVYIGNSLPIREWDLAAAYETPRAVEANRGVNGIDGQIATFVGLARTDVENWAVIGDLTALYDLVGPWALTSREQPLRTRIVVINNGGGKIFSRIFKNDLFENRHSIGFEPWARLWGLGYQKWSRVPVELEAAANEVIELVPDEASTNRFWDRYDGLWV